MRRSPASSDRASEHASEIALEPAFDDKLFHYAADPMRAIAVLEAAFEESFENTGNALGMVPNEVFGIEFGPILFENTVIGF